VLRNNALYGRASLLCQAGAPLHSRVADRVAVRDLPPKGTSSLLFSTWDRECQRQSGCMALWSAGRVPALPACRGPWDHRVSKDKSWLALSPEIL